MFINNIFMNILSMSLAASFSFGMILLVRKILDKKVEISKLNLLWIIFIITLIIPINFSSMLSIKNYIEILDFEYLEEPSNHVVEEQLLDYNFNGVTSLEVESIENINFIFTNITITYSLIAILLMFKDLKIYAKINKIEKETSNERLETILQAQKEKLSIDDNIEMLIQDKVKMPSLYGITDVKILVPSDIIKLNAEEIGMVFMHELIHYKKYHHVVYLLLKILEDLHWFNPIIKIAGKFIREDFEYVVDNEMLNQNCDRIKYSKTILKAIDFQQFNSMNLLPGIYENKTSLERRIKKMKNNTGNMKYSVILIVVAAVIISTFTIVFASEKIDKAVESINIETAISSPLKKYEITNKFGEREHPITGEKLMHRGIDLKANQGEEIYAVMDGKVVFTNFETERGNTIRIKHEDGTSSTYAHGTGFLVEPGDAIKAGQAIMTVGSTGMATGPHLHFEMEDAEGNLIDVNKFFE